MKKAEYFGTALGQDIVITGWVGLLGTARLVSVYGEELKNRFPEHILVEIEKKISDNSGVKSRDWLLEKIDLAGENLKDCVQPRHFLQRVQLPGIKGLGMELVEDDSVIDGLYELGRLTGLGYQVDLYRLPILQGCVEVCQELGEDLMELPCGHMVMVVCDNGLRLVRALKEIGVSAVACGFTDGSRDRLLVHGERRMYITPPSRRK